MIQKCYHQGGVGTQDITNSAIAISLIKTMMILSFNNVVFCYRDYGRKWFKIQGKIPLRIIKINLLMDTL